MHFNFSIYKTSPLIRHSGSLSYQVSLFMYVEICQISSYQKSVFRPTGPISQTPAFALMISCFLLCHFRVNVWTIRQRYQGKQCPSMTTTLLESSREQFMGQLFINFPPSLWKNVICICPLLAWTYRVTYTVNHQLVRCHYVLIFVLNLNGYENGLFKAIHRYRTQHNNNYW